MSSDPASSVRALIESGGLRSVYQPIVRLDGEEVVAVEALARGPVGTALESPVALFAAAAAAGLEAELDWACRAAAVEGALRAGLPRSCRLFINAEPRTFGTDPPARHRSILQRGADELSIVMEVTERAIAADPAALFRALDQVRSLGLGVAIDDVGAEPASLGLMPFIRPDVIKLDMALVCKPTDPATAALAAAVRSDAERRGALVLAEGIETDEHLQRALVLGADLGQGWSFGRPVALERSGYEADRPIGLTARGASAATTPWSLVADSPRRRTTTKSLLMAISHHLEALGSDPDTVVLGAFQHVRHFTPATARRYRAMAERSVFVGAVGVDMPEEPAPGVRGARIDRTHPIAGEWTVIVIGPHRAAALIALDAGDQGDDQDRRFHYVITHDRDVVIDAAMSLMRLVVPVAAAGTERLGVAA